MGYRGSLNPFVPGHGTPGGRLCFHFLMARGDMFRGRRPKLDAAARYLNITSIGGSKGMVRGCDSSEDRKIIFIHSSIRITAAA